MSCIQNICQPADNGIQSNDMLCQNEWNNFYSYHFLIAHFNNCLSLKQRITIYDQKQRFKKSKTLDLKPNQTT